MEEAEKVARDRIGKIKRFDPDALPLAVSVPEAARVIGVGISTAWNMIGVGDIRSIRAGERRVLIAKAEISRFLSEGSALYAQAAN